MPLHLASVWQMLVSHACLHQCSLSGSWTRVHPCKPLQPQCDWRARPTGGAGRDRYPGNAAQLVFCLHNSDPFIPPWNTPSLPLDLCLSGASVLHLRRGKQKQLSLETYQDTKKQVFCLSLGRGWVFCPPITGEPKGIPESWGEHANSTVKTWDGIKPRTSVLSPIKCGHST